MPRHENHSNLWQRNKYLRLYQRDQVAYPVGKNKASFSIITFTTINTDNNEVVEIKCSAVKDWIRDGETIATGTYKECYDAIEKEVIRINKSEPPK